MKKKRRRLKRSIVEGFWLVVVVGSALGLINYAIYQAIPTWIAPAYYDVCVITFAIADYFIRKNMNQKANALQIGNGS